MAVEYKKVAYYVDVSIADSKALSVSVLTSEADSKAVSAQSYAESADTSVHSRLSLVDSGIQSQVTAGGAIVSVANIAALSALSHVVGQDVWVTDQLAPYYCTSDS
jgi:hypothetical protein